MVRGGDDQGNARDLFVYVALQPERMIAQVVAVIAGEDDSRVVAQPESVESAEHAADLLIHEGDGGIIGGPHAFLVVGEYGDAIGFGGTPGDALLWNVFQVVLQLLGNGHVLPSVGLEILVRRHHRIVRSDETCGDEEGLVLVFLQEIDRLRGRLVIGLIRAVALVFYTDKHPIRHLRGFPPLQFGCEDVKVEASVVSRRVSFVSLRIEAFRPALGNIHAVCSGDDVSGHPHVKDLSNSGTVASVILEVFSHGLAAFAFVAAIHE